MKFYWNPNYPDCLYCLGKEAVTGEPMLYCLSDRTGGYCPETGKRVPNNYGFHWGTTVWLTTKRSLNKNGFEYIGRIK